MTMSGQRPISSFFTPLAKTSSSSKSPNVTESSKATPAPPKRKGPVKSTGKKTRLNLRAEKAGRSDDDDTMDLPHGDDQEVSSFSKRVRAFSVAEGEKSQDSDYATPAPKRARLEDSVEEEVQEEEKEQEENISPPKNLS